MSDDEDQVMSGEEEEGSDEEESRAADEGPSEAQLAMQRRRQQQQQSGLSEDAQEVLEAAREERKVMEDEIRELRERSERRKRERDEEERRMAEQRSIEDARRKAEEEERKRQKEEAERERRDQRAVKMAEWEKWKNPPTAKRNFVISKKAGEAAGSGDEDDVGEKKSKEQIEAEKRAILQQRLKPLDINGFDSAKLSEKAKELHNLIYRLESEKYDLEKRFKAQQVDMIELADRARQMISVGKQGGLKRKQLKEDETDDIQDRFAGCPSKIEMYSNYERQKDKRSYVERHEVFRGPSFLFPAERIKPEKIVAWGEDGLPIYEEIQGGQEGAAPEPVAAEGGEE